MVYCRRRNYLENPNIRQHLKFKQFGQLKLCFHYHTALPLKTIEQERTSFPLNCKWQHPSVYQTSLYFYDTPLSSKQSPITGSAFSLSERMWLSYKNKTWLFFSQWQTNENEIFCTSTSLRRRESKKFHLVLNWVSTHIRVLSTGYDRSSSLCPRQFKHPSPNPTLFANNLAHKRFELLSAQLKKMSNAIRLFMSPIHWVRDTASTNSVC